MRNKLIKLTALSVFAASAIYAGGYKIPETSTNAVALSAANIAHSHGADAAYYNPANMVFMADKNSLEADLMYIGLDPINYKGTVGTSPTVNISAESESFLVPSLNYVSPKLGDARVGLSIVVPGGLSKRWKNSPAKDVAEEFTLEVIEVNPTVAYPLSDTLSVAVGLRALYSTGVVKSTSAASASRDMTGESIDYGYNLAVAYKPTANLDIGVTYRSNVDLTVEGNAKLYIGDTSGAKVYDGGVSVTVPMPAALDVALAYTFESKTTVEFVYERNFWSAYDQLDFNYVSPISLILSPMDTPIPKNWNDTNAFRLGVTQELDEMAIMFGIVYDETPVPDSSLSFELPDSDSVSISMGGRYAISDSLNIGLSALYSIRKTRTANASSNNAGLNGEFSNSNVLIVSAGVGYSF
jgi:long-chain fatty acid transport protein